VRKHSGFEQSIQLKSLRRVIETNSIFWNTKHYLPLTAETSYFKFLIWAFPTIALS
jgi:hypothetical protein